MTKKLNLSELLNFYDYKDPASNTHATAINAVLGEDLAVALVVHYFQQQRVEVEALPGPVTQKTKSGHRLDKWIAVRSATESVIYQMEIKNWSAHSIGGAPVKKDADESYMREFRKKRWLHQFNVEKLLPSQKQTLKVLTRMSVPSKYSTHTQKALLCFWEPLHPDGEPKTLFEVDVLNDTFSKLTVFSMSNYVSHLRKTADTVEVQMPITDARIAWLQKLYS